MICHVLEMRGAVFNNKHHNEAEMAVAGSLRDVSCPRAFLFCRSAGGLSSWYCVFLHPAVKRDK